jgi:hypothetical protein
MNFGVLLYTNNKFEEAVFENVIKHIYVQVKPKDLLVVSHSPVNQDILQGAANVIYKPVGVWNFDIYKQIELGLGLMNQDVVFFAEHDVLYPHDHYETCMSNLDGGKVNYAHNIVIANAVGYWTYRPSVFQSTCFGKRETLQVATSQKLSYIPTDFSSAAPTFDMGVNEGVPIHEFWNDHEVLDIRHKYNATPTGTADKGQPLFYHTPYWGSHAGIVKKLELTETHGIYYSEVRQ